MEESPLPPARRRFFLAVLLGGVGTALAAAAGWPVLQYLAPLGGGGREEKLRLPASEVPAGGVRFIDFHGRPAVVLQPRPGEFVALNAVCTHLGCIVKWVAERQEFLCPCHGGRFSPDGAVLGGPPPAPLQSYPVSLQGDQVLIG